MTTADYIETLSIILVFIVGIINVFVTVHMNNKTIKSSSISSERNRWREEFRKAVAEFCGYTRHWMKGSVSNNSQKEQELSQKIDYLQSYIKLSLKPDGEDEKHFLKSCSKL
jgi:hypothetical protein